MWISRVTYNLLNELKTAAEQKAHFFESINIQLTRENRRLIERLLAKNNVPLVESPDNIIQQVVAGAQNDYKEEIGDIFEDELGESVIPKDANDERKRAQESDQMEYQP